MMVIISRFVWWLGLAVPGHVIARSWVCKRYTLVAETGWAGLDGRQCLPGGVLRLSGGPSKAHIVTDAVVYLVWLANCCLNGNLGWTGSSL